MNTAPTVLVVEDAEDMRQMICNLVSRLGYEVYEAENGLDGIKLARTLQPALIILDLMMPVAEGDFTLGFLRSTENLKAIPVIVTSAHPRAHNIAQQLGAQAVLSKPFGLTELKRCLESFAPRPS